MERLGARNETTAPSIEAFRPDEANGRPVRQKPTKSDGAVRTFSVGDEVTSFCGSMCGVILAINGDEGLITWSCRGKSVEPLTSLVHAEHDFRS